MERGTTLRCTILGFLLRYLAGNDDLLLLRLACFAILAFWCSVCVAGLLAADSALLFFRCFGEGTEYAIHRVRCLLRDACFAVVSLNAGFLGMVWSWLV